MPLFNRIINLQIGGKLFPNNLRITFDIVKTNQSICNQASIVVYNLSENSRGEIKDLDTEVMLSAGYSEYGGVKLVFKGNVLRANHTYTLPDIMTKLEVGDGIKALRESRQAVSFEEKTNVKDVLQKVASNLGLEIRELPDVEGKYEQGFSHSGSVKDALDKICQRCKATWSIQDNQLQITKDTSASVHAPVKVTMIDGLLEKLEPLGDVRESLFGSTDAIKSGYRFRTLLNPDIQPGRKLTLGGYEGAFRVERVQHQGDNFEGDFISIVEVKELGSE